MNIPHEQEFELYHYGDSIASQIARLGLAEKQVPYKSHHLHLESSGEHMSAAYRQVNPSSLVPTLVHKGEPHYDSYKIIRYLDELFPDQGQSLWSEDSIFTQQIDMLVDEYALKEEHTPGDNFGSAVAGSSIHILNYLLQQRPWWPVFKQYLGHPVRKRGILFALIRTFGKIPGGVYQKCLHAIAKGLVDIETRLSHGGTYLLGDDYTAADLFLSVHFSRLVETGLGDTLSWDKLPRVAAYWQVLQQRPGFTEAISEWHKPDWYGAMDAIYGGQPNPELPSLQAAIETLLEADKR